MKIRSCPFCGSEAILESGSHSLNGGETWKPEYNIICSNHNCICHPDCPKTFNTKEEAIEAWNRRVNNESI